MQNTPIHIYRDQILRKLRSQCLFVGLFVLFCFYINTQNSHAADVQVNASVTFLESLSLVVEEVDFGTFSFSDSAGANDITLSSNDGSITCSNNRDYICPSSGAPGTVGVNGTEGSIIEISCDSSAALSNGSTAFNLEDVKISLSGSEFNCLGVGSNAASHALAGESSENVVSIGAKLVIPETGITQAGEYSTASSGGNPIAIQVTYQ